MIKIAQKTNVSILLNSRLVISPIIAIITYITQMFLIKFSITFNLVNTLFVSHGAKIGIIPNIAK